jgi:hypothetical protein
MCYCWREGFEIGDTIADYEEALKSIAIDEPTMINDLLSLVKKESS